jgi:hypothetical protein
MVTLFADFQAPLPGPDDLVLVSFDGITLLAEPFSAFGPGERSGVHVLAGRGVVAKLDFARGRLFLLTRKIGLSRLDPANGVDVELTIGGATAVENVPLTPAGRDLLVYRRDCDRGGCHDEDDE